MSAPAHGTHAPTWQEFGPIYEPKRKLKVVCIGAGASGLLIAYKIQRHFDDFELTVFEKNTDISGTWFENRYPGCACDVPSHCYTWSFEPKSDWSGTYATAGEIYQYFRDFSSKYNLGKYVRTSHKVVSAVWDDSTAEWKVEAENVETKEIVKTSCHVLLNAGGVLNNWRYPPIPGIQDQFKGTLVHSAAWPEKLDYDGKVLGLIGNGSSGIQILPNTVDKVPKLITFIREPTWVSPPFGQAHHIYTAEEKARFATEQDYHLETRKNIERGMNSNFSLFYTGSTAQNHARAYMQGEMERKLASPELEKLLIPQWSVGCRRITPGPNYLESLSKPNVEVVYGEIASISEKGPVMEDGKEYPVDILVCATGFDTSFKPRFPLIGKDGVSLSEAWKDEPKGYLGLAAAKYPNYFMTLGPNSPVGNGPVLIAIEAQVEYMIQALSKFQKENLRSFTVKSGPVEAFSRWKDEYMEKTIWTEECRSWYKAGSAEGKVAALWPGSTLHYLESIKNVRWEDYEVEHQREKNMWSFLGNGHSTAEARNGDLVFYLRNHDDTPMDRALKPSSWQIDQRSENLPHGITPDKVEIGLEGEKKGAPGGFSTFG